MCKGVPPSFLHVVGQKERGHNMLRFCASRENLSHVSCITKNVRNVAIIKGLGDNTRTECTGLRRFAFPPPRLIIAPQ
jgi:hypothetical protein